MCEKKTVLVTGSAGRVGQAAVIGLLGRGHTVRGFDRAPSPGLPDAIVADLSDLDSLTKSMKGIDALVHLAATPDDVEDPAQNLFPPNFGLFGYDLVLVLVLPEKVPVPELNSCILPQCDGDRWRK